MPYCVKILPCARSHKTWIWVPTVIFTSLTLGKLLNLPKLQFLHPLNGTNTTYFTR